MTRVLRQLKWMATLMIVVGALAGTVISLGILMPIVGPRIEARLSPVLEPSERTTVSRVGDHVIVDLWLTKRRGECRYVRDSAAYLAGSDAAGWRRQWHERPGNVPGPSRPGGEQSFGLWSFHGAQPGETIKGVWMYRCHGEWETPAVVGPWVAP